MMDFVKALGLNVGVSAVILFVLYKFLNSAINRKMAAWQNEGVEDYKHRLSLEADKYRNSLHIKATQQSEAYKKQAEIYKVLQQAMRKAIAAVDREYERHDETFSPIDDKDYYAFKDALDESELYLNDDQLRAFKFFGVSLGNASPDPYGPPPSEDQVRNLYNDLLFIQDRLNDAMRRAIGIPVVGNPLQDIHVYRAFKMIHGSGVDGVPAEIFNVARRTSPENIVEMFRPQAATIRHDLLKVYDDENSDKRRHTRWSHQNRTDLKWYADRVMHGDND